jgi:hypothetical protein
MSPNGVRSIVMIVLIALWAMGQGMHLAANAIGYTTWGGRATLIV